MNQANFSATEDFMDLIHTPVCTSKQENDFHRRLKGFYDEETGRLGTLTSTIPLIKDMTINTALSGLKEILVADIGRLMLVLNVEK
jgi:hypothetical protein